MGRSNAGGLIAGATILAAFVLLPAARAAGSGASGPDAWDAPGSRFGHFASGRDLEWGWRPEGAKPNSHLVMGFDLLASALPWNAPRRRFDGLLIGEWALDPRRASLFARARLTLQDQTAPRRVTAMSGLTVGGKWVLRRSPNDSALAALTLSVDTPLGPDDLVLPAPWRIAVGLPLHAGPPGRFGAKLALTLGYSLATPRLLDLTIDSEVFAQIGGLFDLFGRWLVHGGLRFSFAWGFAGAGDRERHALVFGLRSSAGMFISGEYTYGPDVPFAYLLQVGWAFFL